MHKIYIFLSVFLAVFQLGSAQSLKKETLGNQGSSEFVYANNKSYFIQQSIGQGSVIHTYETDRYSLRQGYLQPISPGGISGQQDFNLDAIIFPNPFTSVINIRFKEPVVDLVVIKFYDILGRIIINEPYNPEERIVITLNELASGPYIIRVKMRQQELIANLIRR